MKMDDEKVTLICQSEDEYDFRVTLKCPEGRELTVLIPKPDSPFVIHDPESGHVFGLNLVTEGHYT